ncbi:hypothetical protein FACS1894201_04500 [Bacteroidia bacterium]|nr:hypothetical protein FACS1894201_04500 [Bacteroidia bacterium]
MKKRWKIYCGVVLCVTICATACKRDPFSLIGGGLQPGDELINAKYNDTSACLNITAYTIPDIDSVLTSSFTTFHLGSYNHQDVGTFTANIITQIYPESGELDAIFNNILVDSVVLRLAMSGAYPYSNDMQWLDPMYIRIGELTSPTLIDSASTSASYYSNRDEAHTSGSICPDYLITPSLTDSIPSESDSSVMVANNVLQIPLSNDYGRKILTAARDHCTSFNDFLAQVYGLYIEAVPATGTNSGEILNINFNDTRTRLVVYHKQDYSDTVSTATAFSLSFLGSKSYNYFHTDRSSANPQYLNQLNRSDTTLGQQTLFLQSFNNALISFELPNIRELLNIENGKTIVINHAELVLPVDNTVFRFIPPSRLVMGVVKTQDSIYQIADEAVYSDGYYRSDKSEYRFKITRFVQGVLKASATDPIPTVTLFDEARLSQASVLVAHGADKGFNSGRNFHLEIVYSVIP